MTLPQEVSWRHGDVVEKGALHIVEKVTGVYWQLQKHHMYLQMRGWQMQDIQPLCNITYNPVITKTKEPRVRFRTCGAKRGAKALFLASTRFVIIPCSVTWLFSNAT